MSTQTTAQAQLTITDLTDISDVYLEYCMTEAGLTASQVESKTTWTSPERGWGTTYPTWQSGYEIWIRQVQIKEGIEEPEYGTPYLDNAVNQINSDLEDINTTINTTEANLEALQSKLGKIWRNESERLHNHWYDEDHNSSTPSIQWTKPDYPTGTYAASGTVEFNLYTGNTSGNPSQRRLYELNESNEYVLTSDSSFVSGKSYYVRTITIDTEDSSTYKYNTYLSHNKLALRYNAIDMTALTTNALTFYIPTRKNNDWIQGEKGLEITADGIDLYYGANSKSLQINNNGLVIYRNDSNNTKGVELDEDSLSFYGSDPKSPDAQLWSNGLTLQKGGITAGVYNKENRGVAHITDAIEDGPINSLITTFEFTQSGSGEPSLTNVRDFTGVAETYLFKTNRNLLQRQGVTTYPYTHRGITYTLNDDKSVTANGTATGGYSYCKVGASFVVHEDCILTGCPAGGSSSTYELQLGDAGRIRRDYGEGILLTPNNGKPESIYVVIREGQTVENLTFYPMIRLATDLDSTYEYQALRYYRSLNNTYYKGTYDFISGTLTITHKIYDVTFASRTSTNVSGKYRFSTPTITDIKKPTSGELPDMYCNRLPVNTSNKVLNAQQGVAIHSSDNKIYVYIPELATNTLAEAQAWLTENPIQVVYPLENPEVIQLTGLTIKTYEGINNFWSRQGAISIEWGDFIYLSTDPYGPYTINSIEASDWKQIIGTNFGVRTDGSMYASNANINGTIYATNGSFSGELAAQLGFIGAWSINQDGLFYYPKQEEGGESIDILNFTQLTPSLFQLANENEITTFFAEDSFQINNIISWKSESNPNNLIITTNDIQLDGILIKDMLNSHYTAHIEAEQILGSRIGTIEIENSIKNKFITANETNNQLILKRIANISASAIDITDTQIKMSLNNNIITTYKDNLVHTTFGEFENLRMRTGNNQGNLTWITHSNGRLSLKVIQ